MGLNWIESVLFGLFSGMTEILPVSARAHRQIYFKIFGADSSLDVLHLLIHLSIFAALYLTNRNHITRILRALKLARIPKKKRKRPLDFKSIMDFRLWRLMTVCLVMMYLLHSVVSVAESNLLFVSAMLFLNGLILYLPQFFPSGNKDSRTLSRVDAVLMGAAQGAAILPGISGIGAAVSLGSFRGMARNTALNLAFFGEMAAVICLVILDLRGIAAHGIGALSVMILLKYIVSAAMSFLGAYSGIKILRTLAEEKGYTVFGYYCWGLALFTFILNLLA